METEQPCEEVGMKTSTPSDHNSDHSGGYEKDKGNCQVRLYSNTPTVLVLALRMNQWRAGDSKMQKHRDMMYGCQVWFVFFFSFF